MTEASGWWGVAGGFLGGGLEGDGLGEGCITERAVQWIVYIIFPLMTMFWGLGRPLKKNVY